MSAQLSFYTFNRTKYEMYILSVAHGKLIMQSYSSCLTKISSMFCVKTTSNFGWAALRNTAEEFDSSVLVFGGFIILETWENMSPKL